MFSASRALPVLLAGSIAAATDNSAPPCPASAPDAPGEAACAALASDGAAATVTARFVSGGPAIPAHCRVKGPLRPVPGSTIGFVLLLPAGDAWTGRLQMFGNGGCSTAARADDPSATRPLCPYPARAVFRRGAPDEAASFVCTAPAAVGRPPHHKGETS